MQCLYLIAGNFCEVEIFTIFVIKHQVIKNSSQKILLTKINLRIVHTVSSHYLSCTQSEIVGDVVIGCEPVAKLKTVSWKDCGGICESLCL